MIININMEFSKNGYTIYITKEKDESWDMFFDRGWFTVSQLHNCHNDKDYNDIVKMAMIWLNVKYRKCKYNIDVINKLKKMTKNLDMY